MYIIVIGNVIGLPFMRIHGALTCYDHTSLSLMWRSFIETESYYIVVNWMLTTVYKSSRHHGFYYFSVSCICGRPQSRTYQDQEKPVISMVKILCLHFFLLH